MSDRLVIRRECPDQPDVVALLASLNSYRAALYPPAADHMLDVQALRDPGVGFFVARHGGQAVGTAAFRGMAGGARTNGASYGEIKRMYVDPVHRGRQIGAHLLHALESRLRSQGLRLALLETGRAQMRGVRLYERGGYTSRGPFGVHTDNGLSAFYGKAL